MKEVVLMLFIVTAGLFSAQCIPEVVEQLASYHRDGEIIVYNKYEFLHPYRRITHEEMLAYNRHLGIRAGEPVGISLNDGAWESDWNQMPMSDYSHPSSLISVTSNPSDRSASPAIF